MRVSDDAQYAQKHYLAPSTLPLHTHHLSKSLVRARRQLQNDALLGLLICGSRLVQFLPQHEIVLHHPTVDIPGSADAQSLPDSISALLFGDYISPPMADPNAQEAPL